MNVHKKSVVELVILLICLRWIFLYKKAPPGCYAFTHIRGGGFRRPGFGGGVSGAAVSVLGSVSVFLVSSGLPIGRGDLGRTAAEWLVEGIVAENG